MLARSLRDTAIWVVRHPGEAAYAVPRHVRPLHQYSVRAVADGLVGTDLPENAGAPTPALRR